MPTTFFVRLFLALLLAYPGILACAEFRHTCSTISLHKNETMLVGHNLDEYIPCPGLLIVNKRGVFKQSVSYKDLRPWPFRPGNLPRIQWTSKYSSITYNVMGRDFPDGGMNEAGFYVGEMSLVGSVYPKDSGLVKLYHNVWIQYLLDNFATVPEALDTLSRVTVDGHCQWHFYLCDREGRTAMVEFLDGKTTVYQGAEMPVKVATNYTYSSCVKMLGTYQGFGGSKPLELTRPTSESKDLRFHHAALMLRQVETGQREATVDQVFAIMEQMFMANNRWCLVFDLRNNLLYFNTNESRKRKSLSFSAVDFSPNGPVLAMDINLDRGGDIVQELTPLGAERNRAYVSRFLKGIKAGFWAELFWKPWVKRGLLRNQPSGAFPQ